MMELSYGIGRRFSSWIDTRTRVSSLNYSGFFSVSWKRQALKTARLLRNLDCGSLGAIYVSYFMNGWCHAFCHWFDHLNVQRCYGHRAAMNLSSHINLTSRKAYAFLFRYITFLPWILDDLCKCLNYEAFSFSSWPSPEAFTPLLGFVP